MPYFRQIIKISCVSVDGKDMEIWKLFHVVFASVFIEEAVSQLISRGGRLPIRPDPGGRYSGSILKMPEHHMPEYFSFLSMGREKFLLMPVGSWKASCRQMEHTFEPLATGKKSKREEARPEEEQHSRKRTQDPLKWFLCHLPP